MADLQVAPGAVAIILASSSPRRRQLLDRFAMRYRSLVPDVDEDQVSADAGAVDPIGLVALLATTKLARARAQLWDSIPADDHDDARASTTIVLAADTIVIHDDEVLGKPVDRDALRAMLSSYSGTMITVMTAVAVGGGDDDALVEVVSTRVTFGPISDDDIAAYVASGQGDDKAGGLALQAAAGGFIESVDGCWTNVIGLPLCATRRLLGAKGVAVDERCHDRDGRACPAGSMR